MTTSGTYDQVTFSAAKMLDSAARRCNQPTSEITAEQIQIALDEFNLLAKSEYANRGIKLWTVENSYYGLYIGQRAYPLELNTVDAKNVNLRTYTRLTGSGTATSSAGGTVAYAFDADTDTALTQSAPLGNVKYNFGEDVTVTFIGILPNASSTIDYIIEASDDEVTWLTYYDIGSQAYINGTWFWADLPITQGHRFWRLRSGAGTIDVREVVFANNTNDINLYRLDRDNYSTLPNKAFQSRPTQYWWNRERVQPEVVLWPVPNDTFQVLNVYRTRQMQDITSIRQEMEAPTRWWDALVEGLALRMLRNGIGDFTRLTDVSNAKDIALALAENEEQDSGDVHIAPNISGYTR